MNASKYEQERRSYLNQKYLPTEKELTVLMEFKPSKIELNKPQAPSGPSPAQKYIEEKKKRFNLPNGLELQGMPEPEKEVTVQDLSDHKARQEAQGSKLVASKPIGMKQALWLEVRI